MHGPFLTTFPRLQPLKRENICFLWYQLGVGITVRKFEVVRV